MLQSNDLHEGDYLRPNQSTIEVPEFLSDDSSTGTEDIFIRKPSLRTRRKIFTLATTGFVIGSLLILMNSPIRNEFLAPGPLSSNHSQITKGQGADRCAACHESGSLSLTSWIAQAFTGKPVASANQSDLCMKCHSQTLVEEFARKPHNIDPHELQLLSQSTPQSNFKTIAFSKSLGMGAPLNHSGDLACNACHREHHGGEKLALLTDRQCQSCHRQSFQSFENGHPEFSNWPNRQRNAIAFDHSRHATKYFPGQSAAFNCSQCHLDDDFQNVKRLASFDVACAQCHGSQLANASREGLSLISLPMLDLDAIRENGLSVGQWPSQATGDFDGEIPSVMRLILQSDPKARAVFERRGAGFGFGDIDPDDISQVADACQLAWTIKYLIFDLAINGQSGLQQRIESGLGHKLTKEQTRILTGGLDERVFQAVIRRWMPDLASEVPLHRAGKTKAQSTWFPDPNELIAFYGNVEDDELAPNPLTELMKPGSAKKTAPAVPMMANPYVKKTGDDLNVEQQSLVDKSRRVINRSSQFPISHDELLAENPLQKLNPGSPISKLPVQRVEVVPFTQPPSSAPGKTPGLRRETSESRITNPTFGTSLAVQERAFDPNNPVKAIEGPNASGWLRNDSLMEIVYVPTGHADDYSRAWLDAIAKTPDADKRPETSRLFKELTSTTGLVNCRSCHTVGQLSDHSFEVNWAPKYRNPAIRSFTRFSHGAHLLQPGLNDCSTCHQLETGQTNAGSFSNFGSSMIVSNFRPITKSNCTSCHAAGKTSNSCMTCHNYHVGSRVTGSR